MQDVPHIPPTTPLRVDSLTVGTTMAISYAELTGVNTGGAPIISYKLERSPDGTSSWTEVGGFTVQSVQL